MTDQIKIKVGDTAIIPVALAYDISEDEVTSQIRTARNINSRLIATFTVTKTSNSSLLLVLDDAVTSEITDTFGYMDIRRLSGGEPFRVIDDPIEVIFEGVVTG